MFTLTEEMVRTWDRYGGTNLGTSRTNPYDPKKAKELLAEAGYGGGLDAEASGVTLINNHFYGNRAENGGGGVIILYFIILEININRI